MQNNARDARITELEADVARLRALLDSKDVPGTLRHQARNALGLMRAILRRSVETSTSVQDYADHLEGRFDALLRVQAVLIAVSDKSIDLHTVLSNELIAHVIQDGKRATLEGPSLPLDPKSAELLGLVFHELAVNAIKFGAMTVPSGHLTVSWSVSSDDPPWLDLTWSETGLSDLAPLPSFRGFGIETLERMLPYQLGGESTLEFRPEGLHCRIVLPLRTQEAA